jgi:hypothetical protein
MATKKLVEQCKYCQEKLEKKDFYIIYRLLVATNVQLHFIGITKLLDELGDYIMHKGYHLSASQIVLLRPDILKAFLTKKMFPEIPVFWFLQEYEICNDCMKEYIKLIPEK